MDHLAGYLECHAFLILPDLNDRLESSRGDRYHKIVFAFLLIYKNTTIV
jgi:hypothetical protein